MKIIGLTAEQVTLAEQLSAQAHHEWGGEIYSWDAVEAFLTGLLESSPDVDLWALWEDDIRGLLGAVYHPDPRDGEPIATVIFWYVVPECRGHGLGLYRKLLVQCRERGVKRIRPAVAISNATTRLRELYQKLGFHESEVILERAV